MDRHHVGRVVYLSGLVPEVPREELSDHILSRLEVEQILSASSATVVTLRAVVVLGSGSTSFEIIRQISERLPVQMIPHWMDASVQPIAIVDVVEMLVGAMTAPTSTRFFDVGGPEALPYTELLKRYAAVADLTRPQVTLPLLPTELVGTLAGALTDVPNATVTSLMESLRHDMVVGDDTAAMALLPEGYHRVGLDESLRRSLADVTDDLPPAERDPMGPMPQDPHWAIGGENVPLVALVVDAASSLLPGS